jgi:hypothetical protein
MAIRNLNPAKHRAHQDEIDAAQNVFSGALVSKSAAQTAVNGALTLLVWQTENYDEGGWFANSGDSIVTVPAGVGRVRLSAGVAWSGSGGSFKDITFLKNSGLVPGIPFNRGQGGDSLSFIVSPVLVVVPGDEFEVEVRHNVAGDLDVIATGNTYFGIEFAR